MEHNGSNRSIFKIALISITSVLVFLLIVIAISYVIIHVFNLRISIGKHVLRQGGTPILTILKTEEQKETEAFNQKQWDIYYENWFNTKNKLSTSRLKKCRDDFQLIKEKYAYAKEDFEIAARENNLTREICFNYALHGRAQDIEDALTKIINIYDLSSDTPEFIPEIYIGPTYEDQTQETARTRLNQILSDFNKILDFDKNLSCSKTSDIALENYETSCKFMGDLLYNARDVKEPTHIEEGLSVELLESRKKQRLQEKEEWIDDCYEL